jgi:hypothetical protein
MEQGDYRPEQHGRTQTRVFIGLLIAILVLIAVVTAVSSFVSPSGQRFGGWSFVLFWAREISAALLCLIVVVVSVLERLARPRPPVAKPPMRAESNGRAWE